MAAACHGLHRGIRDAPPSQWAAWLAKTFGEEALPTALIHCPCPAEVIRSLVEEQGADVNEPIYDNADGEPGPNA